MVDSLEHGKGGDIHVIPPVHLLRGDCADPGRGVVAEVDVVHGVQVRAFAPVLAAGLDLRLHPDFDLDELEGSGSVGAGLKHAVLFRVEHRQRVVEQVLRQRDLRDLEVEPHRVGVDPFDGARIPDLRAFVVHDVALHQAEHRRAGRGIEAVLQVPDDVVGDELAPVVPVHVLPQMQGPGAEIARRVPLLAQRWAGDVVRRGLGQVLADLTGDLLLVPGVGVRIRHVEHAHAVAVGAALRHRRGVRFRGAEAGERVRGGRGDSEQGGGAQEFTP